MTLFSGFFGFLPPMSIRMQDHQVKCEHCGEWVPVRYETCDHCGKVLRAKEKHEALQRKRLFDPLKPRFIEIRETDPAPLKLIKRMVQFGQLIFYAIISFLVWVTTWTVG